MKKIIMSLAALLFLSISAQAQKYFTRAADIAFYSDAPTEKIEAHNNTVTAILDTESGKVEFAALIKAFEFEKALMQEHFNENYMESSKFPKATFKGAFVDFDATELNSDGTYTANVKGDLSMHGVTNSVTSKVNLTVKNGIVSATTEFTVLVADYGIEIPAVVRENIAKEVKIVVAAEMEEFKKGS